MKTRKKILMISCSQFGYHTDMFKYSKYLSEKYQVYNFCKNQDHTIINIDNVEVRYARSSKNKLFDRISMFIQMKKYIDEINPDYIIIDYFFSCFIINIISRRSKNILDFRTGAVTVNTVKRRVKNKILNLESKFFRNCIVISEGLRDVLKIKCKNTEIISLGADKQVSDKFIKQPMNREIRVFYVGVLTGRNILHTLQGFKLFINKYSQDIPCFYSIVGYGKDKKDEEEIQEYIDKNNLSQYIKFYGRIDNNKLITFFKSHNIGVSYIPLNEWYQIQPPTKTFEYLKNGMICIATDTIENAKVINDCNGILIQDNPDDFFKGLEKIYNSLETYSRTTIFNSVEAYGWKNIVSKLDKFIEKI